jgi:signal transduction histidine kinase
MVDVRLASHGRSVLTSDVSTLRGPLAHPPPDSVRRTPLWGVQSRDPPVASALLAVGAVGLSCLVAVLVLIASGAIDRPVGRVAVHVLVIAAPVATGLYAVRNPRSERLGRLLIVAGALWTLALLAESPSSVAYSTGRVVAWLLFPLLVYLMLSFPQGRIAIRRDRLLFAAVTALVVLLYVASALLVEEYPPHTPWASCDLDCPPNAFLVVSNEPAFVDAVLAPARDLVGVLLLLGVTAALGGRARSSSPMLRVTALPVFLVSIVTTLTLIAFILVRRIAPDAHAADTIGLVWGLCLPGIAAAFSLGLVRRRMLIGNLLTGASGALSASLDPWQVAAAVRSAMGASSVDVLIRDRGRGLWLRRDGSAVDLPDLRESGLVVREIVDDSGPVAAVVIDDDLDSGDELTDAIVSLTEAALRELQLKTDLETSLGDLDDSRKRIATAADAERRRIERDLHDGAQQRLIALRMRLSLAEDLLREDPVAASGAIHDLGVDVDLALEEIRSLAHGIYPALLADRGLADALRSVARRAALPVQIDIAGLSRHPPEIESAVYFTCLEALQNTSKHAGAATMARIVLRQSTGLEFEISDNGQGFDPSGTPRGAGLRNMHDRVDALGGTLSVQSAEGAGCAVRGVVPLRKDVTS